MSFYDLTHKLDPGVLIYPGDPVFSSRQVATVKQDQYNMMSLSMGSHTGTHIDAPYHFFDDGKKIDELDITDLVGPAVIADIRGKGSRERITWEDLSPFASQMQKCHILVIRTGWSQYWGKPTYFDHPFLDKAAAEGIIASGVRVLAVDTLNPDQTMTDGSEGDFAVHKVILGAGGVIAENLTNLEILPPGNVSLSLWPLNLAGCDGSPVRAVAWCT